MKQRIVLIVLAFILIALTSCKTNINGEKPKKTYAIRFSAVGEGNLTATIDGKEINNNTNVEEGATIDFLVLFDEQKYEVDKWLKAEENTFNKSRAKLVVCEEVEVKVIIANKKTVEVTLNLDSDENGKLKATIAGIEVYSGNKIPQGSIVDFEAIANDNYKVSSWHGATPKDEDISRATAVAKTDLNVSAIFTPLPPKDIVITEVKIKNQKVNPYLNSVVIDADKITKDDIKVMGKTVESSAIQLEIEKISPEPHIVTTYGNHIEITTKETQRYKSATISIFVVKHRPNKKYIQINSVSVKNRNVDKETRSVVMNDKEKIAVDDIKLTILKEDGSTEVVNPVSITPKTVIPDNKKNNGRGANCRILYYYDGLSYIVNIFIKHSLTN